MTQSPELKPCPFCWGAAKILKGMSAFDDIEVCCDACGFSGPNFGALSGAETALSDAISHWNRRADLSPTDDECLRNEMVRALVEAVRAFRDFDELPVLAKRPDVFDLQVRLPALRALAALEQEAGRG